MPPIVEPFSKFGFIHWPCVILALAILALLRFKTFWRTFCPDRCGRPDRRIAELHFEPMEMLERSGPLQKIGKSMISRTSKKS